MWWVGVGDGQNDACETPTLRFLLLWLLLARAMHPITPARTDRTFENHTDQNRRRYALEAPKPTEPRGGGEGRNLSRAQAKHDGALDGEGAIYYEAGAKQADVDQFALAR